MRRTFLSGKSIEKEKQLRYKTTARNTDINGIKSMMTIDTTNMCKLLQIERIKWMEQRFNKALAAIKDGSAASLKAIKGDIAELSKYYGSELWKQDLAAEEAGSLPPDLKRGVLSEDGIWNLLSDYREIQKKKQ